MKILVLLLLTIASRIHYQYGHWCGILTYYDHATNQIPFCKTAFSCFLKHSPYKRKNQKCEHINNFILISQELISCFKSAERERERESKQVHACETKTVVTYKLCVFNLLHMRPCRQLCSVCLQKLKIYENYK